MQPSDDHREACEAIVSAAPGLEPIWREHLADNFGEALPHLFLGDVARYFKDWHDTAHEEEVDAFLAAIERLAATKGYEENLINVSFIENLAWGDDDENALLDHYWGRLGPATQRADVAMRNYPAVLDWSDEELERRTAAERRSRSG